jgi:two-component system, NtrC family, response regulator HydG
MSKQALRILVVDDDTDNANSLAELFQLEGHRVDAVYSGEAAIAAYAATRYDIAFMDVMMPGKNGVESFLEIKKLQSDAKIYMMTGYSVEQLLQQAIDNGAMGVLSKPLSMAKVLAVLQDVSPAGIVLIAEDDPDFGPELKQLIESSGMQCELVQNGRDALDKVMAGGVDILILDLKMPLIDGVEVYAQLKKAGRTVKTIIITGNAAEYANTFDAIRDVAITGILNKPFDPIALLGRLESLAA